MFQVVLNFFFIVLKLEPPFKTFKPISEKYLSQILLSDSS